jgi:hypothetical protein
MAYATKCANMERRSSACMSASSIQTLRLDVVKVSPQSVVTTAFDALEAGASEVLADERTRTVKRGLTTDPAIYL